MEYKTAIKEGGEEEDALFSLAEEARFFVYAYNTSTLVTTAGLALGLFFVITALALYFYYYSINDSARSDHSWDGDGGYYAYDTSRMVGVLGLLEEAWAGYGVSKQECRQRLSCEADLLTAVGVNKPAAVTLSGLLRQVTDDDLNQVDRGMAADVRLLRQAAEYGRHFKSCQAYARVCPHTSLAKLTKK